jgi:uncharacterized membrane protein
MKRVTIIMGIVLMIFILLFSCSNNSVYKDANKLLKLSCEVVMLQDEALSTKNLQKAKIAARKAKQVKKIAYKMKEKYSEDDIIKALDRAFVGIPCTQREINRILDNF